MRDEVPELSARDFARAIPRSVRQRLTRGDFRRGDVATLQRFIGLSQAMFAQALGVSVHTLRCWDEGRRAPGGPALVLLRIAARHPRTIRQKVGAAR